MIMDGAINTAMAKLGYHNVKDKQRKVVRAIASGRGVFVALKTGFGKSLCYTMLPFVIHIALPSTLIHIYNFYSVSLRLYP